MRCYMVLINTHAKDELVDSEGYIRFGIRCGHECRRHECAEVSKARSTCTGRDRHGKK